MQYSNQLQKIMFEHDIATIPDAMVLQNKNHLVNFVQEHITKMLHTLYQQIDKMESNQCAEVSTDDFESVERHWFVNLYGDPVGNSPHKRFTVVGPLGERPLHVCALSKCRFGAIDFERRGNYFAEGVEEGIKSYIQSQRATKKVLENVTIPYGKDYCAAVGDFIKRKHPDDTDSCEKIEWDLPTIEDPPFWDELKDWCYQRLKPRNCLDISKEYSEMLVTRGLYEGETILFPFIAENDEHMVSWLLDKEDETLQDLNDKQLPLNGGLEEEEGNAPR